MSIKLKGSSDGSVSFDAPADTSPSGSDITLVLPTTVGSAEQFLKNSGTAGTLEFSSMVETSTGVGIGTTSPSRKLHIVPSGSNAYDAVQVGDGLYIGNTSNNNNAAVFHQGGGADLEIGSQQHITFTTGDIAGSATERMRIDSSGNVGIGTAPASNRKVHIKGTGFTELLVENSDATTSAVMLAAEGGVGSIYTRSTESDSTAVPLTFHTGNDERMRIDSSGNVGIGVSSPDSTLHIPNNGSIRFGVSGATAKGDIAYSNSGAEFLDIKCQGTQANFGNIRFYTGGTPSEAMRIDSSGRVGIGTTATQQTLTIDVNDSGTTQASFNGINIANTNTTANNGSAITFGQTVAGNSNARIGVIQTARGPSESQEMFFGLLGSGSYSERMRIDSSGRLLVGTTVAHAANRNAFENGTTGQISFRHSSTTAGRHNLVGMNSGSAFVITDSSGLTGVQLAYSGTSWATLSDERHKTDLAPIEEGLSKVGTLRAVTGRLITDSETKSRSFLIAQDVQSVLPQAVDTTDPDALALSYTDVIPLLVAALKESKERIETLETKVAALEAQ